MPQWTEKLRMIRLQKKFLLASLIFNLIAGAVSQAHVWAAAVETFAGALQTPWAIARQFGRLRAVVERPDKATYLLTSNHDGGGSPGPQDDRVLRVTFK